jgi:hypothetical protein
MSEAPWYDAGMEGGAGMGALSAAFSHWMRLRLGYQATTRRVLAYGKAANSPYLVAIHGRSFGTTWRFLHSLGVGAVVLAIVLENMTDHVSGLVESGVTPNRLVVLGAAALLTAHIGKTRTQRHVWVEGLDLARPINQREVRKLIAAIADVRAKPTAKWKPDDVILVSGTAGFESEAVTLATSHGIECFRRSGPAEFERVN